MKQNLILLAGMFITCIALVTIVISAFAVLFADAPIAFLVASSVMALSTGCMFVYTFAILIQGE